MPACEEILPTLVDDPADEVRSEEDEHDVIESLTLGLPSDFSTEDREEYNLGELQEYEYCIRVGLAFDQLEGVRMAVKFRAAHIEHKKKNVRSTKANINAEQEIKRAERRAKLLASRYNSNFARITALRPADSKQPKTKSAESRLRAIDLEKDLAIANMAVPRSLGDSRLKHSWIWGVYDQSVDAVQWFRAKAEKDRADEAVNRVCAEFRRTEAGYRAYAALWCKAAESCEQGERAYALKTAHMWEEMACECEKVYDACRRPGIPREVLNQTRVSAPRGGLDSWA
ncbi:hypothetical protein C8Q79DRAFT_896703 [Trametes meyenii]|nr:hypothetical protein C8Q79DRAFT_896703 [Trametes meyenii]